MKSASVIFMSRTEAIMCLLQVVAYMQLWKKNEGIKGYKGSIMMQAL